jgi:hypothetical protein
MHRGRGKPLPFGVNQMVLQRLEKYVQVTNTTDSMIRVRDWQLPNGITDIQPGEVASIPSPVWARCWRTTGLSRAEDVKQAVSEPADDLEGMKMSELWSIASEMELDYRGLKKVELIELIRVAREG